jgi:hypothetical protein
MKTNNKFLTWAPIVLSSLALVVALAAFGKVRHRPTRPLAHVQQSETQPHDAVAHKPQSGEQKKPEGRARKNPANAPQP